MNSAAIIDHIDHFQRRVIQDALLDGSAAYWRRRAEAFEWARPRPGDFAGRATQAELAEIDRRCVTAAEACRARALNAPLDRADFGALVDEVAA